MDKEIDPSNIGKHENLIKQAQAEMAKTDVLVCGKCHNVYHFIELFKQHKDKSCTKDSSLRDCKETKPKVWAFLLWKASQINNSDDLGQTNVNAWKLYQTWVKMDESIRETWVVAGRTIQSFAKIGQSSLQEMPVKITRTVVDVSSDKKPQNTFNRRPNIDMKSKKMSDNENTDTDDDINISRLSARSSKFSDSEVPIKKPVISRLSTNTTVRMSPQQQKTPILLNKNLPVRTAIRTIPNTDETQTQDATVEKILAKRFNPRKKQHEYLIKWENFAHEKNTWELPGNLETCKHLLDNFEQQLARQKEQRARQQLLAQQAEVKQQNTIIKVTSTSSPNTSPSKNRPARNSKVKAMDQVKQWCEEQDTVTTVVPTLKRKATDEEDSDYEATDEQDEEESYMTNKKLKTENVAISNALTKVGQTGNVRIQPVNKVQTVARTLNGGTSPDVKNSAEIVITKDTKSTGVIKKPGALVSPTVKTEPQIRVVQKGETTSSGVVRITQNTATTTTRPINQGVTRLINSGITAKSIPTAKTTTPTTNRQIVRQPTSLPAKPAIQRTQQQLAQAKRSSLSPGGIQQQNNVHAKTTITRIVKSAPNSKNTTPEQRGNVTIQKVDKNQASGIRRVQKKLIPQEDSFEDQEIEDEKEEEEDSFIDDFPQGESTIQRSDSPERPLTLCPFTGAVLGRAEGEKTPPAPSPEPVLKVEKPSLPVPSLSRIVQKNPAQQQPKPQQERKIKQQPPKAATPQPAPPPPAPAPVQEVEEPQQQIQQQEHQEEELMQDDEGQIHQITPITNEDGSPMIVSGEDGTIYQVAGKNAEGQTILIAQGVDGEQQRVYVAACDDDLGLESAMGQDAGEGQFMIKEEDGSDPTQALTIVTDSGDSQDITAEVVQADQPSPGGTRRVVLLLPDGNFMMTDVSAEQYQSLNLVS